MFVFASAQARAQDVPLPSSTPSAAPNKPADPCGDSNLETITASAPTLIVGGKIAPNTKLSVEVAGNSENGEGTSGRISETCFSDDNSLSSSYETSKRNNALRSCRVGISTSEPTAPYGFRGAIAMNGCSRLAFFAIALGVLSLRGARAETSSADVQVHIKDLSFSPKVVRVHVGSVVTWTNDDDMAHTVTSGVDQDAGTWASSTLTNGKSSTVTFMKVGTFPYYCELHSYDESMHGTVIVAK